MGRVYPHVSDDLMVNAQIIDFEITHHKFLGSYIGVGKYLV